MPRCAWPPSLPEHTAREQNLQLHLQGGAAAHGRRVLVLHPHLVVLVVALGHFASVVDLRVRVSEWDRHPYPPSPPSSGHPHTLVRHLGLPSGSVAVPPNSTGSWSGLMNFGSSCFQLPEGARGGLDRRQRGPGPGRDPDVPLACSPGCLLKGAPESVTWPPRPASRPNALSECAKANGARPRSRPMESGQGQCLGKEDEPERNGDLSTDLCFLGRWGDGGHVTHLPESLSSVESPHS